MQYTITVENKTFTHENKKQFVRLLNKEFGSLENLYRKYFDDGRVCAWSGKLIKLIPSFKQNENGQFILINEYKYLACRESGCVCTTMNPRSYDWLLKARGMTKEEAENFSRSIGKKSRSTLNKKSEGLVKHNPYSKEYHMSRGLTEEEALVKINERNRRRKEFWIAKGYPEERAIRMAKFHSATGTTEFLMYFMGYSEEEAKEELKRRSEIQSANNRHNELVTNRSRKGSVDADNFFAELYTEVFGPLGISKEEIFTEAFGGREYFLRNLEGIVWYDFYIPSLKLIIEYCGTHCHAKDPDDNNWKCIFSGRTAKESYDKDQRKKKLAKEQLDVSLYYLYYTGDDKVKFINDLKIKVAKELEKF